MKNLDLKKPGKIFAPLNMTMAVIEMNTKWLKF